MTQKCYNIISKGGQLQMTKKLSKETWKQMYMGIKKIRVNNTEYTISGRNGSLWITITYSYIWGASFEVYYSFGCDYDFVMKDIKKRIKNNEYAVAYYCDHHENGSLYNCIIF